MLPASATVQLLPAHKPTAVFAEESPTLSGYRATILADSVLSEAEAQRVTGTKEDRLVTFVLRFPRIVLSELNTHRVFSRNSASSRAKSLRTTLKEVMEEPYLPFVTENRRGMSGELMDDSQVARAHELILEERDATVAFCLKLLTGRPVTAEDVRREYETLVEDYYETVYRGEGTAESLNVHKQVVNRYLEPFMWHEAVVTSYYWENFFALRDHDDADPAIHALARVMAVALEASTPEVTKTHIPFFSQEFDGGLGLMEQCEASSARAAGVSFHSVVDKPARDALPLARRLLASRHLSPFEHAAISSSEREAVHGSPRNFGGGWIQYRSLVD